MLPNREASPTPAPFLNDLVGRSSSMRELLHEIELVAPTDVTVLIEGETGSGKSLVAHALHRLSRRQNRPLVRIDASGLGEEYFDSELFGYIPGVFPEAPEVREGLASVADGGTLFFDNVDQLPADSQGRLSRFLDSRLVQPLGAPHPRPVDVRILAAAKNDLHGLVSEGSYRSDLYYRLRGFLLRVPPLRDRQEDLPVLVDQLIARFQVRYGKQIAGVAPAAIQALQAHPFEENLRDLEREVESAVVRTPAGQTLQAEFLPLTTAHLDSSGDIPLRQYRRDQERVIVEEALAATRWNVSAASRKLGLSRVGLSKKIKALGLRRPPSMPLGRPPRF